MEPKPLIVVTSSKPLSKKKALKTIESFLEANDNNDITPSSLLNQAKHVVMPEDIIEKLKIIKYFMDTSKSELTDLSQPSIIQAGSSSNNSKSKKETKGSSKESKKSKKNENTVVLESKSNSQTEIEPEIKTEINNDEKNISAKKRKSSFITNEQDVKSEKKLKKKNKLES